MNEHVHEHSASPVAAPAQAGAAASPPARPEPVGVARTGLSLSAKLLLLTSLFVMLAEVLIFVPSIANFRAAWLIDRLTVARIAALAGEARQPQGAIPEQLRKDILDTAKVLAVVIKLNESRRLLMSPDTIPVIDASYDFRAFDSPDFWERTAYRLTLISDAIDVFFSSGNRTIRVFGRPDPGLSRAPDSMDYVEIVMIETPLREAMIRHGLNILALSIVISLITAALVYVALKGLLVEPMMRITRSMLHFAADPEDSGRIIRPSSRTDELGTAERELERMQRQLSQLIQQKSRLAELGLAVSKINHDLRNMLASAHLISDRFAGVPDPTVQRFAPKLIASLDRAIEFCNATLRYGRAEEAPPNRILFEVAGIVEEAAEGLGLPRDGMSLVIDAGEGVRVDADREHLYRVLNNIMRNAVNVLETAPPAGGGRIAVAASRRNGATTIEISDNGPGVPERIRARLFQPFQSGARKGGTGLGLAIAAELVRAHGGEISLQNAKAGACFRIVIPDRPGA